MDALKQYFVSFPDKMDPTLRPPAHFGKFAVLSSIGIFCCLIYAIAAAPADYPEFHFKEDGAITALSSISLAVISAMAASLFYIRVKESPFGSLLWLAISGGCLLLSIDEQLMFHERAGFSLTAANGPSGLIREWDDFVVMFYGVAALGFAGLFAGEFLKCRTFVVFFLIGFSFYVLHTAVDTIFMGSVAWKPFVEETAKLLSVFCVMLGMAAHLGARIDKLTAATGSGEEPAAWQFSRQYAASKDQNSNQIPLG